MATDVQNMSRPRERSFSPLARAARSPLSVIGLLLVGLHLFFALFAPLMAPYSISAILTDGLTPPSDLHWLGTDQIGRDYMSRLMAGGRVALLVSLTGVSVALVVGTTLGIVAGYLGGLGHLGRLVDDLIMRLTDAMMAVPELLLIAILVLTFGKEIWALSLIVAIVYTPGAVRVIRSRTISIVAFDFIRAAELRGEKTGFIMIREIAPNLRGLISRRWHQLHSAWGVVKHWVSWAKADRANLPLPGRCWVMPGKAGSFLPGASVSGIQMYSP